MKRYILHVIVSSKNLDKGFTITPDPDLSNMGIKRKAASTSRLGIGFLGTYLISSATNKTTGEGVMLSQDIFKQSISDFQHEMRGNYIKPLPGGVSKFQQKDTLKNRHHQNTSNMDVNYFVLSIAEYDMETNQKKFVHRMPNPDEIVDASLTGTMNRQFQDLYFVLPEEMKPEMAKELKQFYVVDNADTTSNILVLAEKCYPTAALARRAIQSEDVQHKLKVANEPSTETENETEMKPIKRG